MSNSLESPGAPSSQRRCIFDPIKAHLFFPLFCAHQVIATRVVGVLRGRVSLSLSLPLLYIRLTYLYASHTTHSFSLSVSLRNAQYIIYASIQTTFVHSSLHPHCYLPRRVIVLLNVFFFFSPILLPLSNRIKDALQRYIIDFNVCEIIIYKFSQECARARS